MLDRDHIIQHRAYNQRLTGEPLDSLEAVVRRLGAVQAQEYYEAKWSLALRGDGLVDGDVERAFDEGRILRTHVMRPTWHFVAPEDIRWLLKLTAPRVKVAIGSFLRKFGLDSEVIGRSNEALARALQGGKQLQRSELEAVLREAGIVKEGEDRLRFTHLIMCAELDGVICSGARDGKQFTYALLEERAPQGRNLEGEEALAELARRYFTSHGPATAHDFSWWSGLTMAQVREGLALVNGELASAVVEDRQYWFPKVARPPMPRGQAWLLQSFDEYLIGYKDRSAVLDPADGYHIDREMRMPVVYEGRAVGTWQRRFGRGSTQVNVRPFSSFDEAQREAIAGAAERYSAFLEMPVEVDYLL